MTFSKPRNGRFDLLMRPPTNLATGAELEIEVAAQGPNERILTTTFRAKVVPLPEPRKTKKSVPEPSSQRRPPYHLYYVTEAEWQDKPCWNDQPWTTEDAGSFREPTDTMPLVLIINEDMGLLRLYRESLKARKLEPASVKERVTRYTSHIAFHLYQMYLNLRTAQEKQRQVEPDSPLPDPEQWKGEINRVGATLIKVMQVSR